MSYRTPNEWDEEDVTAPMTPQEQNPCVTPTPTPTPNPTPTPAPTVMPSDAQPWEPLPAIDIKSIFMLHELGLNLVLRMKYPRVETRVKSDFFWVRGPPPEVIAAKAYLTENLIEYFYVGIVPLPRNLQESECWHILENPQVKAIMERDQSKPLNQFRLFTHETIMHPINNVLDTSAHETLTRWVQSIRATDTHFLLAVFPKASPHKNEYERVIQKAVDDVFVMCKKRLKKQKLQQQYLKQQQQQQQQQQLQQQQQCQEHQQEEEYKYVENMPPVSTPPPPPMPLRQHQNTHYHTNQQQHNQQYYQKHEEARGDKNRQQQTQYTNTESHNNRRQSHGFAPNNTQYSNIQHHAPDFQNPNYQSMRKDYHNNNQYGNCQRPGTAVQAYHRRYQSSVQGNDYCAPQVQKGHDGQARGTLRQQCAPPKDNASLDAADDSRSEYIECEKMPFQQFFAVYATGELFDLEKSLRVRFEYADNEYVLVRNAPPQVLQRAVQQLMRLAANYVIESVLQKASDDETDKILEQYVYEFRWRDGNKFVHYKPLLWSCDKCLKCAQDLYKDFGARKALDFFKAESQNNANFYLIARNNFLRVPVRALDDLFEKVRHENNSHEQRGLRTRKVRN